MIKIVWYKEAKEDKVRKTQHQVYRRIFVKNNKY